MGLENLIKGTALGRYAQNKANTLLNSAAQKNQAEKEAEEILESLRGTRYYDLAAKDASWVRTYQDLKGNAQAKAYMEWLTNVRAAMTKYAQAASDEAYNERSFGRELAAEKAAGVNADLTGLTGTPTTAAEGDIAGAGAPVYNPAENFDQSMNRIATAGNVVSDLLGGVVTLGQGIGAVLGTSLDNSQKMVELITGATEKYTDLAENLRGSDNVHQNIMDILFGSNGKPGAIQGLSGRQMRKVREAVNKFGQAYGTGYVDTINENSAKAAISESEQNARTAEYNNMVDKVSGIHDTQGKLFQVQADGMAKKAMNDLKILKLQQKKAILEGKYDIEKISMLDADAAAIAENTKNFADIATDETRKAYQETLSGEEMARSENAKNTHLTDYYENYNGKTKAEREQEIERINTEIAKLEGQGEIIVKQTELNSIKAVQFAGKFGLLPQIGAGWITRGKANAYKNARGGGQSAGGALVGLIKKAFAK